MSSLESELLRVAVFADRAGRNETQRHTAPRDIIRAVRE
jgi:hypothetical protein